MHKLGLICPVNGLRPLPLTPTEAGAAAANPAENWLHACLMGYVSWYAAQAGAEGFRLHVRDPFGIRAALLAGAPFVLHEPCMGWLTGAGADKARAACAEYRMGNATPGAIAGAHMCAVVDDMLEECDDILCVLQTPGPSRIYLNRALNSAKPIYLIDADRYTAGMVAG